MNKKKLDYFDATAPYIDTAIINGKEISIWLVDLIHNGQIVGTVSCDNKKDIKKYSERWLKS
jgi:hypothetical protein